MTEMTGLDPIVRSVTVRTSQADAFRLFTEGCGSWWPLETHSLLDGRAETVVWEGKVDGRIFERSSDGTEGSWGMVLAWDPPNRVVYEWKPNTSAAPPTEIEVRFTPEGDVTRVQIEHRGWERLGDIAEVARASYDSPDGWTMVIARYLAAAGE